MKLALLLSVLAIAAPSNARGNERGKDLYKTCIQCHGDKGEGQKEKKAPKIGGQHDWYLKTSLKQFQNKKRPHPPMMPFIKKLSPQDIDDLAQYISGLR